MNYTEACKQIDELLNAIEAIELPYSQISSGIGVLRQDLRANMYSVVVLGEFKRGKSTLLNALIGNQLLPVDVTPTTAAIHVLRYSETPLVRIHYADGTIQDRSYSTAVLEEYVAGADFSPESLQYIEVGIPSPLLQHGMVYIDTPGVDDLNQQRMDVTYRFVPRADAIIFLLDATAPVRRSEQEFLVSTVLASGVERILFVANFADMVDDDEKEELLGQTERRLAAVLGNQQYPVILLSARQALQGVLEDDTAVIEVSGFPSLLARLRDIQCHGPASQEKVSRYSGRLLRLLRDALRESEMQEMVLVSSDEAIGTQLALLREELQRREARKAAISQWVHDRDQEIIAIVRKSLNYFAAEMQDDVDELVKGFKGTDFKEFVEDRIPTLVKRRLKGWLESHTAPLVSLLSQLDRQLASGLAREFQTQVGSLALRRVSPYVAPTTELSLTADDVSNSTMVAGLITGGAAAAILVLGGPVLLPLVSMAGFPLLQKILLENNLSAAKAKLLPKLHALLHDVLERFTTEMIKVIEAEISALQQGAEARYEALLEDFRLRMASEQQRRAIERQDTGMQINALRAMRERIKQLICEVEQITHTMKEAV